MEEPIRDVLERLIRPLVEADGGTLEIIRSDEKSVLLKLGGNCNGCPGAPFTRQRIIERTLRALVRADLKIDFETIAPAALRGTSPGNVASQVVALPVVKRGEGA